MRFLRCRCETQIMVVLAPVGVMVVVSLAVVAEVEDGSNSSNDSVINGINSV